MGGSVLEGCDSLEFDINGNLPQGIHRPDLIRFRQKFVDSFADSTKRSELYKGYIILSKRCCDLLFVRSHWVDGSYLTAKKDPGDIDMSIHVDGASLDSYAMGGNGFLSNEESIRNLKKSYGCDVYIIPVYPKDSPLYRITEGWEDYWANWWGHTRDQKRKGYVEFDFTSETHRQNVGKEHSRLGEAE